MTTTNNTLRIRLNAGRAQAPADAIVYDPMAEKAGKWGVPSLLSNIIATNRQKTGRDFTPADRRRAIAFGLRAHSLDQMILMLSQAGHQVFHIPAYSDEDRFMSLMTKIYSCLRNGHHGYNVSMVSVGFPAEFEERNAAWLISDTAEAPEDERSRVRQRRAGVPDVTIVIHAASRNTIASSVESLGEEFAGVTFAFFDGKRQLPSWANVALADEPVETSDPEFVRRLNALRAIEIFARVDALLEVNSMVETPLLEMVIQNQRHQGEFLAQLALEYDEDVVSFDIDQTIERPVIVERPATTEHLTVLKEKFMNLRAAPARDDHQRARSQRDYDDSGRGGRGGKRARLLDA